MTLILAKPVIKNQYWILKQGDEKIGNIEANDSGYTVKINNATQTFKTISMVKQRVGIAFEPMPARTVPRRTDSVHGYPAGCRVFNPMYEVRQHLPLFTKSAKSKSWHAAGWYRIYQNRRWHQVQSPKLITLQRYPYQGPFHSQEQAQ